MYEFIKWSDIEVRGVEKGVKKTTCPNCSADRKKKKDPCLYVNFNDGVAKCFNCEALGFRDSDKDKDYTVKHYELPKQDWKNYTNISDNLVKYFEGRKIAQSTIKDLGITEETYYQPQLRKEVNNIVFNYFEGSQLVNKKYRSGNKAFTQSAGTKNIFYNINSVIGQDEVYIVEGEFDVLALHDHGVKNVISVPNGANDNDDYWENSQKYLKEVKKFIIAVDNDEKGNELKERIAQRLGRYRCEYIEWESGKDANDCKINNTLDKELYNRKRFPVSGTFSTEDLKDAILELHKNGLPNTIKLDNQCFKGGDNEKDFNEIFSVMRGHLVTITGIPSHGKSNFSEWYALNLMNDNNLKFSFYSPEHNPMALHQSNFIQKAVGKPFFGNYDGIERVTEKDIERYVEWSKNRLYLTSADNGVTPSWDWVLEKFKEQMFSFGVDCFVVDAFNKVKLPKGMKKLDAINEVLTDLTNFAQANNVIVFLVAHPTKMQKNEKGLYAMPTLYDVSGSSDFRNQTHDGFGIYRFFDTENEKGYTSFSNLKTKMSFQGEMGKTFNFEYDVPTGRYYAKGTNPPRFDMTRPKEEQVELKIENKPLPINDNFEFESGIETDDIPF